MTRRFCTAFVFALVAALALASPAQAVTLPLSDLPSALGQVTIYTVNGLEQTAGAPPVAYGYFSGLNGAQGNVLGKPIPLVNALATSDINNGGGVALVSELYYFQVFGPSTQQVPIFMHGLLNSFSSSDVPNSQAGASIVIGLGGADASLFAAEVRTQLGWPSTLQFDQKALIATDTIYQVALAADASAAFGEVAYASADPYFFIDPTFANASQYSFQFSDGIGNDPLVTPLPPALQMFCTALFALGAFACWRRRQEIA